ncbi:MAG: TonB-dependent receptor [Gammaproteobacteria bacterium]|nr:TonB-dependent receptor [Gammaproteobacteria bacterium]MBU1978702.1 TonB-dependent receptor [Gammaproteobacteria bacterium]
MGALALALTQTVFAEEAPLYRADEIVVTATRFPSKPDVSPVNVTVITREDIARSPARSLPELLMEQAGIHGRNTTGTPDWSIDMRGFGMTGNQNTLVLLDGQRLNDIDQSTVKWSAIPVGAIERIEIMRNSGAVLYGDGASGGTINIITRAPTKGISGEVKATAASYNTSNLEGLLNIGGETASLRLAANQYESDGYRLNNQNIQKNLEGDLRFDAGKNEFSLKFGADSQTLRLPGNRLVDPTIGVNQLETDRRGTTTPNDYATRDGHHIGLGINRLLDFGEFAAEVTYRSKSETIYNQSSWGDRYLETDLDMLSATPRLKINGNAFGLPHSLVTGLDLMEWQYDARGATSPATISTPANHPAGTERSLAIYAQDSTRLGDATTLLVGGRIQSINYHVKDLVNPANDQSQQRSPRAFELGLRHQIDRQTSLFGKLGRSFRIATVNDVYNSYSYTVNMLEPQTSHDREVGIEHQGGGYSLRGTLYHMDLNNEIHYNAITFENMNLSPTRRQGMELEGKLAISRNADLFANYSYTDAKFREGTYSDSFSPSINVSGNNIPNVPKHRATLGGSLALSGKTRLNGTVSYTGEQHFDNDQANSFGQKIPAYTVVDLKLVHREGDWTMAAGINNLLNEKYFTYGTRSTDPTKPGRYTAYPMTERNLAVTLGYTFK